MTTYQTTYESRKREIDCPEVLLGNAKIRRQKLCQKIGRLSSIQNRETETIQRPTIFISINLLLQGSIDRFCHKHANLNSLER